MDFKKIAREILANVGNEENIKDVIHCHTRLRFSLIDSDKVNKDNLSKIEGVITVVESMDQLQVVIGSNVDKVYKELEKMLGKTTDVSNNEVLKNEKTKGNSFNKALTTMAQIFTPTIYALAGSGMIKGILAVVSMYYLNVPFHCYGTRRKIHISKSNSYVDLMKSLWDLYDVYSLKSRRQRSYVIEYLSKVYVITVYLLLKSNQKEQIELLNVHLGFNDPKLYKALTKRVYGFLISSSNEKLYGMLIKVFEKVYQLEIEE